MLLDHPVAADLASQLGDAVLLDDEIIVDNFAGGGGTSTGLDRALQALYEAGLIPRKRHVDVAINHDPEAIAMHKANHPHTQHYCQSVWAIDPRDVKPGRKVGLAWFSPDCKHFSKAKGGKPVEKHIRDLAWVVVHWARLRRPRIIMMENVEEFRDWGPLIQREDGRLYPDPERKGKEFAKWVKAIRRCGYKVEWRELRACDYGTPTIRKRLFLIARCDARPIIWPQPSHTRNGEGGLLPWRSAAECMDWSLPIRSIFGRPRDLKPATHRRVARGVIRHVVQTPQPYLVPLTHQGGPRTHAVTDPVPTVTGANRGEMALVVPVTHTQGGNAARSVEEPLVTCTTAKGGEQALVVPVITRVDHTSAAARNGVQPVEDPLRTITGGGGLALAAATIAETGYGERAGQAPRAQDITQPLGTVVAKGKHMVVVPHITKFRGGATSHDITEPLHTITAGGAMKRDAGAPHALGMVATWIAQQNSERGDGVKPGRPIDAPVSTILGTGSHQQLAAAALVQQYGSNLTASGGEIDVPLPTVTAQGQHIAVMAVHLIKYYGTAIGQAALQPLHSVTAKDRLALVCAEISTPPMSEDERYAAWWVARFLEEHGDLPAPELPGQRPAMVLAGNGCPIIDILLRMLAPRELFRAQGFPDSYVIDPELNGKRLTKTSQVARCGNSVPPPMAEALAIANLAGTAEPMRRAA